jgi:hypothetical protein
VNRVHNKLVLDLLFTLAVWHAYAKLRIHTEKTVSDFEETTKGLGTQLRQFAKHCEKSFDTKELPQEYASRGRKAAKKSAAKGVSKGPGAAKRKLLNLNTYKLHALGHYPANIRRFGTSDSYSSQTVSTRIQTKVMSLIHVVYAG